MKKSVEELEKTLNANKAKKVIPVTIIKPEKVNIEPVNKDILNDVCYGDCGCCHDEYCPAKTWDEDHRLLSSQDPVETDCEFVETEKELGDLADLSDILPLSENEHGAVIKNGKHAVDGKVFPELIPGAADIVKKYNVYRDAVDSWIEHHHGFPKAIAKACLLDDYPVKENNETENLSPNEELFKTIVSKMFYTYKRKNKDYGASFDELFDEYGMTSALLRIKDKYNRLKAINDNGQIEVKDESVEDTLLDMANYAILTIIKLRNNKTTNKGSETLDEIKDVEISNGTLKFKK